MSKKPSHAARIRKVQMDARLGLIRAAASVVRPNGRTVAEELRLCLPQYQVTPKGERTKVAREAARAVLPGAQWLEEVVEATFNMWLSPRCPLEHRDKLALPMSADEVC